MASVCKEIFTGVPFIFLKTKTLRILRLLFGYWKDLLSLDLLKKKTPVSIRLKISSIIITMNTSEKFMVFLLEFSDES